MPSITPARLNLQRYGNVWREPWWPASSDSAMPKVVSERGANRTRLDLRVELGDELFVPL